MDNNILTAYSVLKKLHDKSFDLINAYIPFVEYAIYKLNKKFVEIEAIQNFLLHNTNLTIPLNTIRTILKRLYKDNKISQFDGYKIIEVTNLDEDLISEYRELFEQSTRERNKLILNFKKYYNLDVDENKILQNIVDFIYDSICTHDILETYETFELLKEEYIAIAKYIDHIKNYDNELYKIFQNLYYGTLLSKVNDVNKINSYKVNIKKVTIILDSNILFRLLDLQNPIFNKTSKEFINILEKNDFELKCFYKTVEEMRSVLNHRYNLFLNKKIDINLPETETQIIDGIIGAIYRNKFSLSDIEDLIKNIEIKISNLGIKVDHYDVLSNIKYDEKDYKYYYQEKIKKQIKLNKIDEYDTDYDITDLIENKEIPKYVHNFIDSKVQLDLKIRNYIINERSKKDIYTFPDCKYIFVTCDKQLANLCNYLDKQHTIPEIILEDKLTNILWLSNPSRTDDIPLQLTLSIYNSSNYIDYKILTNFHLYLKKFKDKNPADFDLIGDIFSNQLVISRLKNIEIESNTLSDHDYENIVQLAINANKGKVNILEENLNRIIEEKEVEKVEKERTKQTLIDTENENDILKQESDKTFKILIKVFSIIYFFIPVIISLILLLAFQKPYGNLVDFFKVCLKNSNFNKIDLLKNLHPTIWFIIVWCYSIFSYTDYKEFFKYSISNLFKFSVFLKIIVKTIGNFITLGIYPLLKKIGFPK